MIMKYGLCGCPYDAPDAEQSQVGVVIEVVKG
jgi:hypothetical protein